MDISIYIGDGVYATFTGHSIELSLGSHKSPSVVSLDLGAVDALKIFKDNTLAQMEEKDD